MKIRPFEPKDTEPVKTLISSIITNEFPELIKAYSIDDLDNIPKCYGKKRETFLVLENGDKLVGTAAIKEEDKDTAFLRRLFVAPSFRKRGYGKSLIENAVKFCKQQHYKQIIFQGNEKMIAALRLCAKYGFKEQEAAVIDNLAILRYVLFLEKPK